MRRLVLALAGAIGILASPAFADGSPVVVELYTSQGCSSCPPADKVLAQLAGREDVIALALHVDYWDYIGWKDDFADPAFTQRQRAYAMAAGHKSIYTPQMIISGEDHFIGSEPMKIMDEIHQRSQQPMPVEVTLDRNGGQVSVRVDAGAGQVPGGAAVIELITYIPSATVDIRRGENAGRTVQYVNIVRDIRQIGSFDGSAPFRKTVDSPADMPVVVLVQSAPIGPILGAAQLR